MNGLIEWVCPSNIALVKYWGKRPGQLPANPSLSITLSESVTRLKMEYEYNPVNNFSLEFHFNNKPSPPEFGQKVADYLSKIKSVLPEIDHLKLKINSSNTFPHSAGIASSASSFGALALALSSMSEEIRGVKQSKEDFLKKASFLARIGSGSACRSVYGGFVLWGSYEGISGSSDEAAFPVSGVNPQFHSMRDSILVVSSEPKSISSSRGHQLMNENVFAPQRRIQALNNLQKMLSALGEGNLNEFISIMENEALTLHSLMMTSSPGFILMKPATLEIISRIRNFRSREGIPAGFTLDAGPNVHLIFHSSAEDAIRKLIETELSEYCEKVIYDRIGKGPEREEQS